MFTLRAAVHTNMQYTPAQLIFGRNSIINRRHIVDYETTRKQKQDLINKGKKRENRN